MVTLGYLLIVLAPVLCVIWIVWSHRRKGAARAAARSERVAQLLGTATAPGAAAAPAAEGNQGTPASAPPPPDAHRVQAGAAPTGTGASSPSVLYAARPQLLDGPRAELYEALRRELRGYTVLAHVSLAALLEVPPAVQGRAREQRQRVLMQYTADCVVCGDGMRVLAVVDVDATHDAEARFKAECLQAAGIRHVRVDPAALAGAADLQARVLG